MKLIQMKILPRKKFWHIQFQFIKIKISINFIVGSCSSVNEVYILKLHIYISYSKDYLLIFNANVMDVHELPYKVKF